MQTLYLSKIKMESSAFRLHPRGLLLDASRPDDCGQKRSHTKSRGFTFRREGFELNLAVFCYSFRSL